MRLIRGIKSFLKFFIDLIYDLFTDHPKSVGESYFGHMFVAAKMSLLSLIASMVFLIHSIFPFLFKRTGCSIIEEMDFECSRSKSHGDSTNPFGDNFF